MLEEAGVCYVDVARLVAGGPAVAWPPGASPTPRLKAPGGGVAIIGIGLDVAEVARIRAALDHPRTGTRFRARVFTAREQAYCEARERGRYQSYAVRFAAKEATMKALGRGWSADVGWLDVEVVRAASGRPEIVLHGPAAAYAARLGVARLHVSLTHTADLGVANVIAEGAA